jgi:hypothetical protein
MEQAEQASDEVRQAVVPSGGSYYNGQGIYSMMEHEFGLAQSADGWHLLGVKNGTNQVFAVFKLTSSGQPDQDAQTQIMEAVAGTSHYDVYKLDAQNQGQTNIVLTLRDRSTGQTVTKSGDALEGLLLKVTFPAGGPSGVFSMRLHKPAGLTGDPSLKGYSIDYWNDSNPSQVSNYCSVTNGVAEPVVFVPGTKTHPLTASRTADSSFVDMSCASGGIVACMLWGYKPWSNGSAGPDLHQACIQMKRAAYCGVQPYTEEGHTIYVRDSLNPQVNNGTGSTSEAYWGVNGALCLDNRRDTNVDFSGCTPALPSCATVPSGWLLHNDF